MGIRGREGRIALGALLVAAGALLTACAGVQQAVDAPINAIGASDTVIETNVNVALQSAETEYTEASSYSSFGTGYSPDTGETFTLDQSTKPNIVSYGIDPTGQALVFAAYNTGDNTCLGAIQIASPVATPILGVSQTGTYYFKDPHIVSAGCDATRYLHYTIPVPGWPSGDPSSGSWPS